MAQRSLLNRVWYRFAQRWLQLAGVVVYQMRCTGRENIPAEGGVLVVSNHQSMFDPPLVGMACSRRMNYLARSTLFGFAPLGWLMSSLDAFPIDREGSGLAGVKETLRRLKRGEMVLIFPEGTRTADGEIAPFHPGFTSLAVRGRAAILPVAIEGAYQVWPRGQNLPGLGTIHVHYGVPMPLEQIRDYEERELAAEVERRVRRCHALLRENPLFARHRVVRRNRSRDIWGEGVRLLGV